MRLVVGDSLTSHFILYTDTPLHCLKYINRVKSVAAKLVLVKHIANPAPTIPRLERGNNALVKGLEFACSI